MDERVAPFDGRKPPAVLALLVEVELRRVRSERPLARGLPSSSSSMKSGKSSFLEMNSLDLEKEGRASRQSFLAKIHEQESGRTHCFRALRPREGLVSSSASSSVKFMSVTAPFR